MNKYESFDNDELIILASALEDGSFIYPKDTKVSNKLSKEIKHELKQRHIILSNKPLLEKVE